MIASTEAAQIVVVAPSSHLAIAREIADRVLGADPWSAVVPGGNTRQLSVAAGLAALADSVETVLVHDSARALTPPDLIDRVARVVAATGGGVVPALPVIDTVKRVDGQLVVDNVDRSELVTAQTPQGFPRRLLDAVYEAPEADHTDDAALFAAAGHPVQIVEGHHRALKITTEWDLRRAEWLLAEAAPVAVTAATRHRTGIGVDVHAFAEDAPLWLAGLFWPGETGLAGHSDGDAVAHAICDALLSAAGLGDLGARFGSAEPEYAGAAGEVFLAQTARLVAEAGFAIENVAVQLIAARPRFAPRRAEAEAVLSGIVGAPVHLSATTSDGLGFTGRGEGVTALATALLTSTAPPSREK